MTEAVNMVPHYNGDEVAKFIESQELDFFLGNVVKYVARAGKKLKEKTLEDLEKARWYLNYKIVKLGGLDWNPKTKVITDNLKALDDEIHNPAKVISKSRPIDYNSANDAYRLGFDAGFNGQPSEEFKFENFTMLYTDAYRAGAALREASKEE